MNYQHISMDDMNNGDGLRTVLWVSGCSHHCKGCQNEHTWDKNGGVLFDERAKEELFENLSKPWIKGVTLSGGDPLCECNRAEIEKLVKEIRDRFPQKDIWCYTGYTFGEIKHLPFIKMIDVLVDGEYIEKLRDINLKWRGSSNQNVIDVKKTYAAGMIVLYCD